MKLNKEIKLKYFEALKNQPNLKIIGNEFYKFLKRTIDILASLFAILLLSWLFIIIAILVKSTSRGSIIYKSIRYADKGKYFNMYKFRSMYKDAEERKAELMAQNEVEGGVTFKMKNDSRIIPFGRFLRKTSLDKLPQLFNILLGHISIVGPSVGLYDDSFYGVFATKSQFFFKKIYKKFIKIFLSDTTLTTGVYDLVDPCFGPLI